MNQKIKELFQEAAYKEFPSHIVSIHPVELKVFAVLIIQEMLQTCEDHPGWTGRMIGEQIKQHFGVE